MNDKASTTKKLTATLMALVLAVGLMPAPALASVTAADAGHGLTVQYHKYDDYDKQYYTNLGYTLNTVSFGEVFFRCGHASYDQGDFWTFNKFPDGKGGYNDPAPLQYDTQGAAVWNRVWSSTNPKVATVDQKGLVTIHGVGTTYIVCTATIREDDETGEIETVTDKSKLDVVDVDEWDAAQAAKEKAAAAAKAKAKAKSSTTTTTKVKQTLTVNNKVGYAKANVKKSTLKKKGKVTVKFKSIVKGAKGKLTYKLAKPANKKKQNYSVNLKKLTATVNKKTKFTKKKLTIPVTVTAAATDNYLKTSKTVNLTIVLK